MTISAAPPPTPLQAVADTVVTIQARTGLEVAADLALVVLALALAGFFVLFLIFVLRMRKLDSGLRRTAVKLRSGMDPVMERAGNVAENVDFITRAIRADVEKLNESVTRLNERLQQASDRMEDRIEEFNALMEVVQGEAEEIFIDTASAVRGVREGTRALGEGVRRPSARPGAAGARPSSSAPEEEEA